MWKWIKVPKGIALLAFFLPWMTVSCSGNEMISATGFGLAFGKFTTDLPADNALTASGAQTNLLLILALVAIVVGLLLAFLPRGKTSTALLAATSIAGIALIWLGTSRYSKSAVLAEAAKHRGRTTRLLDFASGIDRSAANLIQVHWHPGLYLAVAALVATAIMALISYNEHNTGAQPR
ncbi:MAG: hypothetical protein ABW023_12105 [Sphingomonas sp.]